MHNVVEANPDQMDALYTIALRGIKKRHVHIARQIFQLLVCNPAGCYTEEVEDYAGLHDSAERSAFQALREICFSPLVQVTDSKVSLHHTSVQDFLVRKKQGEVELMESFTFSMREAHEHVALVCIDRLTQYRHSPFLGHAVKRLFYHCAGACEESPADFAASSVPQRLIDAFDLTPAFTRWQTATGDRIQEYETPLHAALINRCPRLALSMLNSGTTQLDLKSSVGTPLYIAADLHYTEVVRVLLKLGADANAASGPIGSALCAACNGTTSDEDTELICVLLDSTSTYTLNQSIGDHGTPLHLASSWGNANIVKLLLEAGADPNTLGGLFGNALQAACARGHRDAAVVLLKHGARPHETCGILGSAFRAARSGPSGVSELADYFMNGMYEKHPPTGRLWQEATRQTMEVLTNAVKHQACVQSQLEALAAPSKALEDMFFPLPEFARPLTSTQMTIFLVHRFTTPSLQLYDLLHAQPIVRASGLFTEIEIAFDRQPGLAWDGTLPSEYWNTSYFVEKNMFRAMLHACIAMVWNALHLLAKILIAKQAGASNAEPFLDSASVSFLTTLLRTWQATAHYEDLVLENYQTEHEVTLKMAPFHRAVVNLFSYMLQALSHLFTVIQSRVGSSGGYGTQPVPFDGYAMALKTLENEAHDHASRYLQCKQIAMLAEMKQAQTMLAAKVEEVKAVRLKKVEDKIMAELKAMKEALSGGARSPTPSMAVATAGTDLGEVK